jgi:lipocalin
MIFLTIVILILWALMGLTNGQGAPPRCFKVNPIFNFDTFSILGTWYEVERIDYFFEAGLKCVKAEYSRLDDSIGMMAAIGVKNTGVDEKTGALSVANGHAIVPNPLVPNRLLVKFPIISKGKVVGENTGDYQIIDSDGRSYLLVYSCTQMADRVSEIVWILSRQKKLGKNILNILKAKVTALGINISRLKPVAQDC